VDIQAAVLKQQLRGQLKDAKVASTNAAQNFHDVQRPAQAPATSFRTDASREGVHGVLSAKLLSRISVGELREVVGELSANVLDGQSRVWIRKRATVVDK